MAKLVIQNQGMTGRAHELNIDRTTIGRVEDNTFQISDPSVSSHHCEVQLQGGEVLIRDLNSTNGSFINGEKFTETILKPGQTLRLGQVELKLELEGGVPSAPAAPGTVPAPAPALAKKHVDSTMVIPRGVSLDELEKVGRPPGFDTANTSFSKKTDKINKFFIIGGIIIFLLIVGLIVYSLSLAGNHK
jgi:pSer/pThr/pTyr-binding forkhead associated (FHA) protein